MSVTDATPDFLPPDGVPSQWGGPAPAEPAPAYCYRHPKVATQIRCRRCGRPICGQCMIQAPVGFQCPECVKSFARQTRVSEGPYGGAPPANPWLTSIVIVAINAAVFLLIFATGGSGSAWSGRLGLIPKGLCLVDGTGSFYPGLSTPETCQRVGGTLWRAGVAAGAWWQVVTSVFVHVALMHIAVNCLSLIFIGPPVERIIGRARFVALYVVSGLVGSVAVMWLAPAESLSYGGSGALFGLMGALLVLAWQRRFDIRSILFWIGLNIVFTFIGPNISWQAHLGGLAGGVAITAILVWMPGGRHRGRNQWLALAGLVVVSVAVIGLRAIVLAG